MGVGVGGHGHSGHVFLKVEIINTIHKLVHGVSTVLLLNFSVVLHTSILLGKSYNLKSS
jgi:hypothetical protein